MQTTNKINILFIITQMAMGGSERLVYNIVHKIDRGIFNPSIAWFNGDRVLKEFSNLEIPLYHVPKIKRFDFNTMKKLGNIIRDNNIHIVNAHHFMPAVYSYYGCKIADSKKLLYTFHSEWEIKQISRGWRIIGSFLSNRSDGVIGVTEKVTNTAKEFFKLDSSKVFTIQNGVDINVSENSYEKDIKKNLGIEDNEKVIGIVANLKRIKNQIFLLKAFKELIKILKPVKLLVIGQGFENDIENTEQELRNFVDENGLDKNVLFLGYRSDIAELLKIMDIFCLTSFKEGLPVSLIEAMAAGLPVVGTNVEGIRDVIITNKNGFLVQLDDINGLKDALYNLLKDEALRNKMGNESKALAMSNYSITECINKYQDLFFSLLRQ